MNLAYLCKNYPLTMRVLLGLLLVTGLWFLIVTVIILIENGEDFINGIQECFSYVIRGYDHDRDGR